MPTYIIPKRQGDADRAPEQARERALTVLAGLTSAKPWEVKIQVHRKKRSNDQNALYHKWVEVIWKDTGDSHQSTHEWIRDEFCPPKPVTVGGVTKMVKSTTLLDTAEMAEFMRQVDAWAGSFLAIDLPHPEDAQRNW